MLLDIESKSIRDLSGKEMANLSDIQIKLLEFLIKNKGKIVTRESIITNVWNGVHISSRSVDIHISNIRKFVGFESIKTIPAAGYKLIGPISIMKTKKNAIGEVQLHRKYVNGSDSICVPFIEESSDSYYCMILNGEDAMVRYESIEKIFFNQFKEWQSE